MKKLQTLSSLFIAISLVVFPIAPASAQVDMTPPADMTAPAPESASTPAPEPSPTSEPTPESEPVMETVAPADTTPPVISDVSSMSLGLNETTISWSTDELATSKVRYGTTSALGQTAVLEGSGTLMHATTLMNLESGMTYRYCIDATDNAGNTSESCGYTFVTDTEPVATDTIPPAISEVTVSNITTSAATVGWKTDEVSSGYVEYGTTAEYGSLTVFDMELSTDHSQDLSGLSPDTEYHYRVVATDEAGNEIGSPDNTFTTEPLSPAESAPTEPIQSPSEPAPAETAPTDETTTTPPANSTATEPVAETFVFHSITPEYITHTSVTIRWETSIPADSLIEYGQMASLGQSSDHSTALATVHEVAITGLDPDTLYYFRAVSKPSGVAAGTSELHEFTTLAEPVIVNPAADITSVSVSDITQTGAMVTAMTSEFTTGTVEYGTTTAYGTTSSVSASAESHAIAVSGLAPETTYHYRVKAVDDGGNETYSLDRTFTTATAQISGNTVPTATEPMPETQQQTPASPETEAPGEESVASASIVISGGGGSGGIYIAPPGIPLLTTAAPADSEIIFMWNNPSATGFSGVKLLRKEGAYPASPTDGEIIYQGQSETFTDTGLTNNYTYYYALYAYNTYGLYSAPLNISLAPKQGVEEVTVEKVPVIEETAPALHFGADLAFGDQSDEVIHLQQLLNVENVHYSGLTTGYFGPLTQASLVKFQAKYNLPQTGMADAATREKLTAISQSHIIIGAPDALTALDTDLKRGDAGENVGYLQEFLAYEGSYPEAKITQTFGPLTQSAVIIFQQKYGITPAVGYVGPKTRHTIQNALGL